MLNVEVVVLEFCLLLPGPEVPGKGSGQGLVCQREAWQHPGGAKPRFPQEYGPCATVRNAPGEHNTPKNLLLKL